MKRVIDVTGSARFGTFFESLSEENTFKIEIKEAIKILSEDCTNGDKIEHDKWPNFYIKEYNINNLWRFDLSEGKRFVYTILGTPEGFIVSIIEVFSNHSEYDKRFGY